MLKLTVKLRIKKLTLLTKKILTELNKHFCNITLGPSKHEGHRYLYAFQEC